MEGTQEYLCFVKFIGTDIDGLNIYEFLFTNTIDSFWGENFEVFPSCLCNELIPNESEYNLVQQIKTELKFNLAQESCCTSYQDAIDGIIAVAYYVFEDESPLVFRFGDSLESVVSSLVAKKIHIS